MGRLKVVAVWESDILQQGNDECTKAVATVGRQVGQYGSDEFDIDAFLWDLISISVYGIRIASD